MRALAPAAGLAVALVLAPLARGEAGKLAVGIAPGASVQEAAAALEQATGRPVDRSLSPLGALVVNVPNVQEAAAAASDLPEVRWTEPVGTRRLVFTPNDELAFFQWYLPAIHAFDFWQTMPELPRVRVAVIDSGVDASHPDLADRIAAGASFVKTSWKTDEDGHGTVVAGEIAAATDNGYGIAGVAFPAELLIAKVLRRDGSISVQAEAEAIKWAVRSGADVINLSLGGDRFDRLEQAAVNYAYASGAVVVAAAGNCDTASCSHATYPAALPHVIGVGAIDRDRKPLPFSNRDPRYVDLAAPGTQILSTYPLALSTSSCPEPGFNFCAAPGHGRDTGTSFAAPLVSAAAALLRAQRPELVGSQVMRLLESSADDVGAVGRDAATGNGELDVQQALIDATAKPLPPPDRRERSDSGGTTNDDAPGAPRLYGRRPGVVATFDWYDDPDDVYRVYLRARERVRVLLRAPQGGPATLAVWRPRTKHVTPITLVARRAGFLLAYRTVASPQLTVQAPSTGWYFVDVRPGKGNGGQYRLTVQRLR